MGTPVINPKLGASLKVAPASGIGLKDGFQVVEFIFSNSYATNGEVVAVPGFTTIDHVVITEEAAAAAAKNTYYWDPANSKIKAIVVSTGAEVAAATDLSATKLWLLVFGS